VKIVRVGDEYLIQHKKNVAHRDYFVETGTRFKKFTVQQQALELLIELVVNVTNDYCKLCSLFNGIKVKNGYSVNLDTSYLNLIISSHPEFFKLSLDKKVIIKQYPVGNGSENLRILRGKKMKEQLEIQEQKLVTEKKIKKRKRERETIKAIGNFRSIEDNKNINNTKEYLTK